MDDVIRLEHVTKRYRVKGKDHTLAKGISATLDPEKRKYVTALDDVSLSVRRGEIFGILGPNGAGKTTLIKIVAGVLMPDVGKAAVSGMDVIEDRRGARTSVSLLRSGGWVIFDYKLSLYENLKFWGVMHDGIPLKDMDARIRKVLDIVGLSEKINEPPEKLSAGMRQKLALALTLMSDRPIYLMDEPTANIDPKSADFLRRFFRDKLARKGKTIVLATHNLWEAEMICDRIAILDKGKVLVLDTTENIKRKVGKEVMEVRMGAVSDALVSELESLAYVESVQREERALKVFGSVKDNVPELLRICAASSTIESTTVADASINDIFLQLVGREEA